MKDSGLILPSFDLLNQHAQSVKEMTAPLRKLGITLFSHTRVYKDHTFIDVSDRADMLDYFYYQSDIYKHYSPDVNPWAFKEKFFLCSSLDSNPSIAGLRNYLNIDNIIVLIEQHETHCELWHFGSEANNHKIINFYLNNLDILRSFAMFFNEAASAIIKDCEKHSIKRPENLIKQCNEEVFLQDESSLGDFYKHINTKGLNLSYNNHPIRLSRRELEILKWCILGKSTQETSSILNISNRTVEHHLANIKDKFECYKNIDIVRILSKLGIMNMILKNPD